MSNEKSDAMYINEERPDGGISARVRDLEHAREFSKLGCIPSKESLYGVESRLREDDPSIEKWEKIENLNEEVLQGLKAKYPKAIHSIILGNGYEVGLLDTTPLLNSDNSLNKEAKETLNSNFYNSFFIFSRFGIARCEINQLNQVEHHIPEAARDSVKKTEVEGIMRDFIDMVVLGKRRGGKDSNINSVHNLIGTSGYKRDFSVHTNREGFNNPGFALEDLKIVLESCNRIESNKLNKSAESILSSL